MNFDAPLIRGMLIRRYKRFLADVTLDTGETVTAHCANPGSMMGLAAPGTEVWLEPNDNPRRKLKFAWRLARIDGAWVGVDTLAANRIADEALRAGAIPGLAAYAEVRAEVKYGASSRVDFLLRGDGLPDAYVEVKSVTLSREAGWAEFPDSVTIRGAKHLAALSAVADLGARAVMLYVVQRTDCRRFRLAADLDPGYVAAFVCARAHGIEAIAWSCAMGLEEIRLDAPVAITENQND